MFNILSKMNPFSGSPNPNTQEQKKDPIDISKLTDKILSFSETTPNHMQAVILEHQLNRAQEENPRELEQAMFMVYMKGIDWNDTKLQCLALETIMEIDPTLSFLSQQQKSALKFELILSPQKIDTYRSEKEAVQTYWKQFISAGELQKIALQIQNCDAIRRHDPEGNYLTEEQASRMKNLLDRGITNNLPDAIPAMFELYSRYVNEEDYVGQDTTMEDIKKYDPEFSHLTEQQKLLFNTQKQLQDLKKKLEKLDTDTK